MKKDCWGFTFFIIIASFLVFLVGCSSSVVPETIHVTPVVKSIEQKKDEEPISTVDVDKIEEFDENHEPEDSGSEEIVVEVEEVVQRQEDVILVLDQDTESEEPLVEESVISIAEFMEPVIQQVSDVTPIDESKTQIETVREESVVEIPYESVPEIFIETMESTVPEVTELLEELEMLEVEKPQEKPDNLERLEVTEPLEIIEMAEVESVSDPFAEAIEVEAYSVVNMVQPAMGLEDADNPKTQKAQIPASLLPRLRILIIVFAIVLLLVFLFFVFGSKVDSDKLARFQREVRASGIMAPEDGATRLHVSGSNSKTIDIDSLRPIQTPSAERAVVIEEPDKKTEEFDGNFKDIKFEDREFSNEDFEYSFVASEFSEPSFADVVFENSVFKGELQDIEFKNLEGPVSSIAFDERPFDNDKQLLRDFEFKDIAFEKIDMREDLSFDSVNYDWELFKTRNS